MLRTLSTYRLIIAAFILAFAALSATAQEKNTLAIQPAKEKSDSASIATMRRTTIADTATPIIFTKSDSIALDSTYKAMQNTAPTLPSDSSIVARKRAVVGNGAENITFRKPDPQKALWLALVFPGAGQMYNRKFWKLPIVYGGFVGCLYAYNWNGQMYKDYRQAYLDIMDSDPNTDSFKDFFRPGFNFEANKDYLKSVFKRRKDRYRRWRDMSIFVFIGVYAVSVIDAYVDAQLATFDIADDINLSIEPQMMKGESELFNNKDYYGLNLNITF